MALWQFTVELVPRRNYGLSIVIERGDVDTETAWADYSLNGEFIAKEIDLLIPRTPAWCAGMARWGDDKTDDLQLWWFEDGRIASLTARFDTRVVSEDFISRVSRAAMVLGLSAILPAGQIIATPTAELLISQTRRSLAAAFAQPAQGSA